MDAKGRIREASVDHQEMAKSREQHALEIRSLHQGTRVAEGELGQAREHIASLKRRHEWMEAETQEAKRLRHALSE